jgi:predicted NBD/HSP70 family sugar kinase
MLWDLHLNGPQSRSDLAVKLQLNRSTVASLVTELGERGFVWEHGQSRETPAGPGRPSPVVELRSDGPAVVAVELATDWINAAIIGLGGNVIVASRRDHSLAQSDPSDIVEQLHEIVAALRLRLHTKTPLVAMGVSVPGAVRAEDGYLHHAPNLGWRDVRLGEMIRARFKDDLAVPVFIRNDADLAAGAEHIRGAGLGANDFICLWGEGGIGAGFVVNGQSLSGSAGYAGEVGHLMVDPNGELCHCGSRGCWEAQVGEEALLRRAGLDPLGGAGAVAGLLVAADGGDASALAALKESGRWLGIGIAGLVNVFNPTRVALGGLYARIYPYVEDAVRRELDTRAMPAPRAMVELTTVLLGPFTLLLGAAELALAPALQDPTSVPLIRGGRRPEDAARRYRQGRPDGQGTGGSPASTQGGDAI